MATAMSRWVLALVVLVVLTFGMDARAGLVFNNPSFANYTQINAAGRTIAQTQGNVSLAKFNTLDRFVFDFESTNTGNNNWENYDNGSLQLTASTYYPAQTVTARDIGAGYAILNNTVDPRFTSSGEYSLASQTLSELRFTFSNPVRGAAFTLNRLIGTATVTLLDSGANPVGSLTGYTFPDNGSASGDQNMAFFGFVGDTTDNLITEVRITGFSAAGNQLNVDDFAFTFSVVPEPASAAMLLVGSVLLLRRKRPA